MKILSSNVDLNKGASLYAAYKQLPESMPHDERVSYLALNHDEVSDLEFEVACAVVEKRLRVFVEKPVLHTGFVSGGIEDAIVRRALDYDNNPSNAILATVEKHKYPLSKATKTKSFAQKHPVVGEAKRIHEVMPR